MKFTVDKKEMQQIANTAIKLAGKFLHACIVSDGNELRIIINSDTYVNILVPSAKVKGKGIVGLQSEIFSQLFSLRGSTIKAEFDPKQNKLDVTCGTSASFYVIALKNSDVKEPIVEGEDKLKLSAKATGSLKTMLKLSKYESPDINTTDYALFLNTKDAFHILCSSDNSFAFFSQKEPINKKEFTITAPVSMFNIAFEVCSTSTDINISESLIMLKSDNIVVTFPTLQDNTEKKTLSNFNLLRDNKLYKKGKIEFNGSELTNVLNSIRAISGGKDAVSFKATSDKVILGLESKYGKSKDHCKLESNSLGNVNIELSELFFASTLSMATSINKKVIFQLAKESNLYKLKSFTDNHSIECFGPVIK